MRAGSCRCSIIITIATGAIAALAFLYNKSKRSEYKWVRSKKMRIVGIALGEPRYFRRKATIACSAGRRRLIQMSDGAWRILGKRWTLPILKIVGSREPVRFNEIKKALVGISSTMLTEILSELEHEGLVSKNFNGSKIVYSLTSSARELELILIKLDAWWSLHRTVPPITR